MIRISTVSNVCKIGVAFGGVPIIKIKVEVCDVFYRVFATKAGLYTVQLLLLLFCIQQSERVSFTLQNSANISCIFEYFKYNF